MAGQVLYNGFVPDRREVGFLNDIFIVPEEIYLPSVTLEEYVKVNAPFYPRFSRERMDELIALFRLAPDLHFEACSMGQKKKAFLSFALACNTSLIILDEPTNGLDITSKYDFRKAVSMSMTDERTMIISTHQVHDVDKILDHVVILGEHGVLLNRSMADIASKLRFEFTTDREAIRSALFALEVPGGANIVTRNCDPDFETDVNLELLYELFYRHPGVGSILF